MTSCKRLAKIRNGSGQLEKKRPDSQFCARGLVILNFRFRRFGILWRCVATSFCAASSFRRAPRAAGFAISCERVGNFKSRVFQIRVLSDEKIAKRSGDARQQIPPRIGSQSGPKSDRNDCHGGASDHQISPTIARRLRSDANKAGYLKVPPKRPH